MRWTTIRRVLPEDKAEWLRGQVIGKALLQAAEELARSQGLAEMASDTWLENEVSIQAHLKPGYAEVERAVHIAKKLERA